MTTRAIAEALDHLESYVILEPPGSQSRDVGDKILTAARAALPDEHLAQIEALMEKDVDTARKGVRHFEAKGWHGAAEVTQGELRAYETALGYVKAARARPRQGEGT